MSKGCSWRFTTLLVAVAALSAGAANLVLAQAAETLVVQREITFVPERIDVKVGSSVVFVNDDRFGHNVYSETPGADFDIGRQPAGQRTPVVFRRAGTFEIRCRIHPKMKLDVVVTS
jgi:plastocyanin